MLICHLAQQDDWAASLRTGRYTTSTRGATLDDVGFIHCSTPAQLPEVASFIYPDRPDGLVVLELDDDTITAAGTDVHYEDGGNGSTYPHIYGAIDPSWVTAVRPASFERQGHIHW